MVDWNKATAGILDAAKGTFGVAVTYTPGVGAPVQIKGIFGNAQVEVDLGGESKSVVQQPSLGIKLADLAALPTKQDRVTVNAITYKVVDSQEDGEGGTLLLLHRA